MRKGIVLAGGTGSRLLPITLAGTKHLLPVYDKPMIYYALATLMLAGIRDVLVIGAPQELPRFISLLRDGSQIGMNLTYACQPRPEGIVQAFVIGRDFINGASCALILGDNLFFGNGLRETVQRAGRAPDGAFIFARHVPDPQRYAVVELDDDGTAIGIEEKPDRPRSDCAVTGLYFYDGLVVDIATGIRPSSRGELEITDVNLAYLARTMLRVEMLRSTIDWADAGTPEALLDASNRIAALQQRQGRLIGAIEEVAYRMGFIDAGQLERLVAGLGNGDYARYLTGVLVQAVPDESSPA